MPFVSEAFGFVADLAIALRAIDVISEAGNAALSIVDIVQHPAMAPMAIMGLLGGLSRTESEFSQLAGVRRDLKTYDVSKLGSVFKAKDTQLQTIVSRCKM